MQATGLSVPNTLITPASSPSLVITALTGFLSQTTSASQPSATHLVQVGARGELLFLPNNLSANVRDILEFQFLASNYTLTQSTFKQPCMAINSFNTDFIHFNPLNRTNNTLFFLIQNTNP
jgi:hypothetical protein